MEIRRIEGVLLETIREQSQNLQAQRTNQILQIKLVSQVPEVLLESLKGKETFRAIVTEVSQGKVSLFLDNGYEIVAQNNMSVALQRGDKLELTIQNDNPLTFRVLKLQASPKQELLLESLLKGESPLYFSPVNLKESVFSSGILYERKLLEFFTGKLKLEDILSDTKAQIIKSISQWVNVEGLDNHQLISHLKGIVGDLQRTYREVTLLTQALDTLTLKNLSHDEYVSVIKHLKDGPILKYLEIGNEDKVFEELLKAIEKDENFPIREKFVQALFDLSTLSKDSGDSKLRALVKDLLNNLEGIEELRLYAKDLLETPLMKNLPNLQDLLSKLEFIVAGQYTLLKSGKLFLPIHYEDSRGGIVFDVSDGYRVLVNLNYPNYYVSALISAPRVEKVKSVKVKFSTDSSWMAELLRGGEFMLREMLAQEGLNLSGFYVNVASKEENLKEFIEFVGEEGFHLAV